MPRKLADRLSAVAPSATLAMAAQAARLRSQGHKVYPFSVGEPDFEPPRHVLDAAKAAIDKGVSHYTAVTGTPELKAAICAATERDRGYRPAPNEITVSCGAKHALFNVALGLYEPGDEVVIPAPYWVSYPEQVRIVGATPVIVETREDQGFRMDAASLERAITERTKAIILCTPSNPTGSAYAESDLRALLDVVRRHDLWLVVDEIYADLTYDGFRHVSVPAMAEDLRSRTIIISGVSKTYAMTGWRIGWSITPPELSKVLDVVQSQSTTNATAVAQVAAAAALSGPQDAVREMRDAFAKRRDRMVEGLRSLPGVRCRMPEGAFYAFADVRGLYGIPYKNGTIQTDLDVAMWLLEEAHVASVAGTPFGAPGYVRFSYACSEGDIEGGIEAIRAAATAARGGG
ncbi:pyridoxal phosphate-dependent aminotransferase [Polyangium jinanense]|uniref:Aminotransferase n=1 Tax=Polyangium jinanense TaxID=2829994 RepID=A0A9X3X6T0_9BACT|nr:pyridoxal phosphate-dependent aminotransferase [Polyangium jinanense]MDC3958252.1 pyridoxal phosphate-dependent aminotransferase [Polyangium jinanense]MDC3983413.1 pyridoxal phosphate-dependent aminotransferase [Polyangium jinanense]